MSLLTPVLLLSVTIAVIMVITFLLWTVYTEHFYYFTIVIISHLYL